MTRPELRRPSRDPAVRELQDLLNRIGALLLVDGDYGRLTEGAIKEAQGLAGLAATGVADDATWAFLEAQPEPSSDIPCRCVTFIVQEEVGSRKSYDRIAARPHYPGVESGVTVGLGYDLRFKNATAFERDWGKRLDAADFTALARHLGKRGSEQAIAELAGIEIPFTTAWEVFTRRTLPHTVGSAKRTFEPFPELPALCRGALVSLLYNRGASMQDKPQRREMRAIRDHIAAGNLDQVADEIESMKRLWPNSRGLRIRRDKEAALWREGLES